MVKEQLFDFRAHFIFRLVFMKPYSAPIKVKMIQIQVHHLHLHRSADYFSYVELLSLHQNTSDGDDNAGSFKFRPPLNCWSDVFR